MLDFIVNLFSKDTDIDLVRLPPFILMTLLDVTLLTGPTLPIVVVLFSILS
jgi:hypothetical protein